MNSLLLLLFLVVSAVALYFLIGKAAKPSAQQVEGHPYHKLLQKSWEIARKPNG